MSDSSSSRCEQSDRVCAHALGVLPQAEIAAVEAHVRSCTRCAAELAEMRRVVDAFAAWPQDVLRPSPSLQARLADRIATEHGGEPVLPAVRQWTEPEWKDVAEGIACKILAKDDERDRVSMLVRLAPGAHYPAHVHAGVEELHLLDGELWIDERKLFPGDYNRGEPGAGDKRVWSETGCTCVLVTSTKDVLA
jgi:anti-sigma factor ChrR (cupin superfamily)